MKRRGLDIVIGGRGGEDCRNKKRSLKKRRKGRRIRHCKKRKRRMC